MKKSVLMTSILVMFFLFTACQSVENEAVSGKISDSPKSSSELTSDDPTSINSQPKKRFGSIVPDDFPADFDFTHYIDGTTVVEDKNSDIYFISHTGVHRILSGTDTAETVIDGFTYGHYLAVHNDWIYYVYENRLCRIDKNGNNLYEYPMYLDGGYASVYIYQDQLYFTSYDENIGSLYCADISNDADALEMKKLEVSKSVPEVYRIYMEKLEGMTEQAKKSGISMPLRLIQPTEDYLYLLDQKDRVGRYNNLTNEIEVLSEIQPYTIRNFDIVSGWIYYEDKHGSICRLKEDLSKKEQLTEPFL